MHFKNDIYVSVYVKSLHYYQLSGTLDAPSASVEGIAPPNVTALSFQETV